MVKPFCWERQPRLVLTPDALVSCTEMVDNSTHVFRLGDFMANCLQYVEGAPRRAMHWFTECLHWQWLCCCHVSC